MDIVEGFKVKQSDACIILCGSWAVWTERNARTHGESTRSVLQAVKWAMDSAVDLAETGKQQAVKPAKEVQSWKPPEEPFLKINVDACFDKHTHQGGSGLGVRNHEGRLIRAQALWYETGMSAMAMEAFAARDGVRLASVLGFRRVIIETDAQLVVKQWDSLSVDRSEIATTLNEIQELSGNFDDFRLEFISREANELAHLCAKQCNSSRKRCLWINYIPTFLMTCVRKECNLLVD